MAGQEWYHGSVRPPRRGGVARAGAFAGRAVYNRRATSERTETMLVKTLGALAAVCRADGIPVPWRRPGRPAGTTPHRPLPPRRAARREEGQGGRRRQEHRPRAQRPAGRRVQRLPHRGVPGSRRQGPGGEVAPRRRPRPARLVGDDLPGEPAAAPGRPLRGGVGREGARAQDAPADAVVRAARDAQARPGRRLPLRQETRARPAWRRPPSCRPARSRRRRSCSTRVPKP